MSAQILAFQPNTTGGRNTTRTPQPHHHAPDPLPEREWGLSAGQVVAVVLAIIAACEVLGLIF